MVKVAVLCGALLALSACTADNSTNAESATATSAKHQTLRIAAAANLSDVLPSIIDSYQVDHRVSDSTSDKSDLDIDVTYASSGKLYAQIKAGAPYDLYLSANQAFPQKLADNKRGKSVQPFTYARGQLALYSATKPLNDFTPASLIDAFTSASFTDNSKISIANPDLAPYGASAKAYLQSQKLYDKLSAQKNLIQAENIGQAFQYAYTGSVDYGFVAQSQISAINAKPEQFITLAPESYPAILQDGIIISDKPATIDFTNYLRSAEGQRYFLQAGYLTVQ
ncbi:molybdate ABC transporter substrate-binding protein [uncultured Psychrobacter sp.]|uniref:molybdate ABC transporter substrate-binding protein n=1 Tax=uncultured Psychrobacter sp. TaxID=259303 RepID=UPI00259633D1|nr:molybdate ABC transporter substrate-binding protein [uncultured Psychrobacter sp.]